MVEKLSSCFAPVKTLHEQLLQDGVFKLATAYVRSLHERYGPLAPVIFLVALKCDYYRSRWSVDEAVSRVFALHAHADTCCLLPIRPHFHTGGKAVRAQQQFFFRLTSAKTGMGVNRLFETIVRVVLTRGKKGEAGLLAAEKTESLAVEGKLKAKKAQQSILHRQKSIAKLSCIAVAAEKAEADRLAVEKAEADRLAAEKAEADRLAAEKAEKAAQAQRAKVWLCAPTFV